MAMLEVNHLTAGYSRPIIHDISFSAEHGEFIGIIGHNGCGKTTLFRTLTGGAKSFSGTIQINGWDICKLSMRKRAELLACMTQQSEGSFPNGLRAIDMIEMGYYARKGFLYSLNRSEKSQIEQLAERFGMVSLLFRDLAKMSGGERQLVALMRTVVQDTPVLLLDEPSGSLDFSNTYHLFEMLRDLCSIDGKTVAAVLHDPTLALRFCSRILLMEHGGIIASLIPKQTKIEIIQKTFRRLYPSICVGYEPVSGQYFCYSKEQ